MPKTETEALKKFKTKSSTKDAIKKSAIKDAIVTVTTRYHHHVDHVENYNNARATAK